MNSFRQLKYVNNAYVDIMFHILNGLHRNLAEKFTIRAVITTTPFHKITHSPELLAG
jgi:hypothetical protein